MTAPTELRAAREDSPTPLRADLSNNGGGGGNNRWLTPAVSWLAVNFALLMFAGVMSSYWLINYTSHFEFFGSLLALSGLFSWIAVVVKLIPQEQATGVQRAVQRAMFVPLTTLLLVIITAALVVIFGSLATVEVRNLTNAPVTVRLRGYGGDTVEATRVLPGDFVREVFWTHPFTPTTRAVHVSGYARINRQARPWHIEPLVVGPDDFPIRAVRLNPGGMARTARKGIWVLKMGWSKPTGESSDPKPINEHYQGAELLLDELSPAQDGLLTVGSTVDFSVFEKDVTKVHVFERVEIQATTQPFIEGKLHQ